MCRDIPQLLVIVTVTFIISINASVWLDQHNIKVIFKQWLALITSFSRAILYIFKWEDSLSLFFCLCIFFSFFPLYYLYFISFFLSFSQFLSFLFSFNFEPFDIVIIDTPWCILWFHDRDLTVWNTIYHISIIFVCNT